MDSPNQVFISWSGTLSNKVAQALRDWISVVIQSSNPFMSESSIEPGSRNLGRIAEELNDVKVGLLCVTADNQDSKWLNFEAGAISKQIDESRVVPILFNLEPGQLSPPLAQFQAVKIDDKIGMKSVAETVNRSINTSAPLASATLERSFVLVWDGFAAQIEEIRNSHQSSDAPRIPKRTAGDMFEEIVVALRDITTDVQELMERPKRSTIAELQLEIANRAIRKLAVTHGRREIKDVVDLIPISGAFNAKDWNTIDNAPYLRWFLEAYHGVSRPLNIHSTQEESDMNDVPF